MSTVKRAAQLVHRTLSSQGLAVLLLLYLMGLTLAGTLHQVEHGLFSAKERYFDSLFFEQPLLGAIRVPLPGAYLVLAVLFVNLVFGGILRVRLGWSRAGVYITHIGILLMLAAGFVTHSFSVDGHLTLYEHERSSEFESYHDWEIAVLEPSGGGAVTEHLIDGKGFMPLHPGESATFRSADLPFDVTVSDFFPNCRPMAAPEGGGAPGGPVVDGVALVPAPRDPQDEGNVAGARVTLRERGSGASREGLLYGLERAPWQVEAGGKTWGLELRKRRRPLPFAIALDRFTRELHPRTGMASAFMSDVTMIEGETSRKVRISMNKPLRHGGYTLYQSSWGPPGAGPNDPLYSTFAVVRNPADRIPLISCIVIALGLVLHFGLKLVGYLRAGPRRAV